MKDVTNQSPPHEPLWGQLDRRYWSEGGHGAAGQACNPIGQAVIEPIPPVDLHHTHANLPPRGNGLVAIDRFPDGMVAAGDDLGLLLITACSGTGRN